MKAKMYPFLMMGVLLSGQSHALTKAQINALDGNIVLINEKGGMNGSGPRIQILDADVTDWSKTSAILWEYKLVTGKDGLTLSTSGNWNDCKRVLNKDGKECLLICGNGRGFALFNLETETFEVSNNKPTDKTHSIEILPGNRFAVCRAEYAGDDLQIYGSADDSSTVIDSDEHYNVHAANYDANNNCLWTYGSQGVRKYPYNVSTGKLGTPQTFSGNSGFHDLSPKFGSPGVFYACGGALSEFTVSGNKWRALFDDNNCKNSSYNPVRKEILVPIQGETSSYRSHRCYALTTDGAKKREYNMPADNAAWYKARWFVHNSLRHPVTQTATTVTFTSVAAEDGYLNESSETSNVGGGFSATGTAGAALRIGDTTTKQQHKSVVSFNTSSLPDGAVIQSATLKLMRGAISGTPTNLGNIKVDIKGGSGFNNAVALSKEDFQAAADATGVATMSYPSANGTLSTGSLNATGLSKINKIGKTQLRIYFATDDDNDSTSDYLGFYSAENSTTANRPVLEITYQ